MNQFKLGCLYKVNFPVKIGEVLFSSGEATLLCINEKNENNCYVLYCIECNDYMHLYTGNHYLDYERI
ncbi:MAG: hypothetical protein AABY22_09135 [Nanoarchaeota archaeon]